MVVLVKHGKEFYISFWNIFELALSFICTVPYNCLWAEETKTVLKDSKTELFKVIVQG